MEILNEKSVNLYYFQQAIFNHMKAQYAAIHLNILKSWFCFNIFIGNKSLLSPWSFIFMTIFSNIIYTIQQICLFTLFIWTDLFLYDLLWSYWTLQTIIMIIQIIYMLLISFKNIMIILLLSTLNIYSDPTATLVLNNSIPYHIYAIITCS